MSEKQQSWTTFSLHFFAQQSGARKLFSNLLRVWHWPKLDEGFTSHSTQSKPFYRKRSLQGFYSGVTGVGSPENIWNLPFKLWCILTAIKSLVLADNWVCSGRWLPKKLSWFPHIFHGWPWGQVGGWTPNRRIVSPYIWETLFPANQ